MLSTILLLSTIGQCSGGSCSAPSVAGLGFRLFAGRSSIQASAGRYAQPQSFGTFQGSACSGGSCSVSPAGEIPAFTSPNTLQLTPVQTQATARAYRWLDGYDQGQPRRVWGWVMADGRMAFHEHEQPAEPPSILKHDVAKERAESKSTGTVISSMVEGK